MRSSLVLLTLTALLAAALAQQTYQLVWQDEFNGDKLDTSKWGYQNLCNGGGNNEMQCYSSRPQNVAVRNGSLVLTAIPEPWQNKKYSSGRISTNGKVYWTYGRFDIRAKLPDGIYLWPAIWMMPQGNTYGEWAASGEIDIMENHGGNNFDHSSALHYGGTAPKNAYSGAGLKASVDLTTDFHLYSAIWTPDSITFYLDGVAHFTQNLRKSFNNAARGATPYGSKQGAPFDKPFHFILNLAIGGGFFGKNSQALTYAQAKAWKNPNFYVDYCRVYQLKDGNGGIQPPAFPINGNNQQKTTTTTQKPATPATSAATKPPTITPVPAPAPAPAPTPSTKAPATSQATNTPATSQATNTPATSQANNNNDADCGTCPDGQTACEDAAYGFTCLTPDGPFECAKADNGKSYVCPKGTKACGRACYPPSAYTCQDGWLVQTPQ